MHATGTISAVAVSNRSPCIVAQPDTLRRRFAAGLGRNLALRRLGREPDFDVHRRVVRLSKNPCGHPAARPGARGGGEHRRLECRRRRRLRRTTRHSRSDAGAGALPRLSRGGLCSAIAAVARANDLPVTFFANLIWQESSFRSRTISPAGALGIAQFIPETAVEYGLMNPFEPLHALFAAGKLLRRLNDRFGNLGLAAAAYNAGPQRVRTWMAERRTLPSETHAYVIRITGRPADQWLSSEIRNDPEATLMPAKAPCAEVDEDVRAQARIVRVSRLMSELAAATASPPQVIDDIPLPRKNMRKLQQRDVASAARLQSAVAATPRQPTTSLACARIPCR